MSYLFTLRPDRPYAEFHIDVINWCIPNVGCLQSYDLNASEFKGDGWALSGADRYIAMDSWRNVVEYYFHIEDEYDALSFKLVWGAYIINTLAGN